MENIPEKWKIEENANWTLGAYLKSEIAKTREKNKDYEKKTLNYQFPIAYVAKFKCLAYSRMAGLFKKGWNIQG